ncbi:MAG: hypothetical protein AAF348_11050 [Bacteroidota bacterium]
MDYKREYREIGFRVIFSWQPVTKTFAFAAQPYEQMFDTELNNRPEVFLVRGRVDTGERLEVGFKDFTFEMTSDFHRRLGELYEVIKEEYRNTVVKKI